MLLAFSANAAQLKAYNVPPMQTSRPGRRAASTPPLSPLWSTDEPAAAEGSIDSSDMAKRPWHIQALTVVNESTKWTVSAAVLAVLLWQHNEYAAWCVVGAVLSSFLCKVLKRVLNHERPDNAPKTDPGMPSSHANSLNFLSVYAALSLAHHVNSSPGALALAAAAVGLGVFKTWLRVFLGFHTWPQVLVGAALGATTAVTWFKLGTAWALPALQKSPAGLRVLYTVTALGSAAFGYKVVTGWFKEQRRKQQLSGKVKIAVDTFAEEEFEELTKQLAQQQQEAGGGASGPHERKQQAREGFQSSREGGNGDQPSAGTASNFAA